MISLFPLCLNVWWPWTKTGKFWRPDLLNYETMDPYNISLCIAAIMRKSPKGAAHGANKN